MTTPSESDGQSRQIPADFIAFIEARFGPLRAQREDARRHFNAGCDSEQRRDYAAAVEHYLKVVALDPKHKLVCYFGFNNLGYSLAQVQRFVEAEFYCREAIRYDPRRQNGHKNLGLALQGQGRYAEAAHAFLEATHCAPRDTRAWIHLQELLKAHPDVLAADDRFREDVAALALLMQSGRAGGLQ